MSVAQGHGMASNQRRLAEWEARLARWRTSGTSIRQFFLDEGVCEPSFYQWRKRLLRVGSNASGHARLNGEATTGTAPSEPKPETARFLPVEIVGGKLPGNHRASTKKVCESDGCQGSQDRRGPIRRGNVQFGSGRECHIFRNIATGERHRSDRRCERPFESG